jgi:hypothetical protein
MPDTLGLRALNRATLARQMLLARERVPALQAVERLVAMQAQWPRPPFVGLWSRIDGFDRAELTTLLLDRRVVRATFLRATLHLVSAADFTALRPVVAPVLHASMRAVLRDRVAVLDLDALEARARSLLGAEPRTFEELRDAFLAADPDGDERAMGYAVRMRLPLVQVPEHDAPWAFPSRARFALADEWLGRAVPTDAREAGAAQLVERYLAAYGPASIADMQAWSGLQGLASVVAAMRERLLVFRDDRARELFDLPDAPRPDPDTPAPVRLVPEYDNLVTTRADERIVARDHRPHVFLSALRIAATVLVDGFAAGTWTLDVQKARAAIVVTPFGRFTRHVRRGVVEEAEALVRFAAPEARAHEVRVAD